MRCTSRCETRRARKKRRTSSGHEARLPGLLRSTTIGGQRTSRVRKRFALVDVTLGATGGRGEGARVGRTSLSACDERPRWAPALAGRRPAGARAAGRWFEEKNGQIDKAGGLNPQPNKLRPPGRTPTCSESDGLNLDCGWKQAAGCSVVRRSHHVGLTGDTFSWKEVSTQAWLSRGVVESVGAQGRGGSRC